ncbi:MAG: transcription termination/antitermination protein NusA [Subdoligranulum sp.]|nr:transcription termination/antitermination protein NusA [Subdoligranulum sp.]
MNAEFFEALAMLEKERGLPADYLLEKIKNAIVIAVKKDYNVEDANVSVLIDPSVGQFSVSLLKTVVEEVENPGTQISLEEARQKKKSCQPGDEYAIPLKTKDFGRIAAQTAKHVIRQGLKEAERSQMFAEMQSKAHEIISAVVTNIDPDRGVVTLELGKGGVATLPRSEQVAGEQLEEGQHVKVYVVDVIEGERGPRMMISRTHPGLVKRMFEMEVPEIFDGTVEIKAISREAGARTKIAAYSRDENVDPVGACIGPRGQRVAKIVEELGGEKIDIVRWSEDPAQFISAALSPATVVGVEILEGETRSCRVTVPDHQLSLAIGNKGQNARLCARLTGYNIDIRPESGYYGEEPPVKKAPEANAEKAGAQTDEKAEPDAGAETEAPAEEAKTEPDASAEAETPAE